jgi:integrase/recombinase XerD
MNTEYIEKMRAELLRRRYSPKTIGVYCFCLGKFFEQYDLIPKLVKKSDIINYLNQKAKENKAGSTLNLHLASLKFFFEEVMHRNMHLDIKYSRRPKRLPVFLLKSEVLRLFDAVHNPKHKLMLMMLYSAGLRVNELLHLKVKDIESEQGYGWVRGGKGDKDRYFILAESVKLSLSQYIGALHLDFDDYLFNGRHGPLTDRSVQQMIWQAAKIAKIPKHVHPHTLRHSFATHLIEDGYTVNEVQTLLGHNSVRTTMTYLHMAKPAVSHVKSPLDSMCEAAVI